MPQIVQIPSAPNTALSQLGGALFGGAADYAQNQRLEAREARLREQQLADRSTARTERLADIQDERAFQVGQRQEVRTERLADDRTRDEMAVKSELVRLGYLKPSQIDNPEAFAAALDIVRQNGLAQRYADALKTGDLTMADFGNDAKMQAGLAKYAERLARQTTFQEDQRGRAVTAQNAAATDEARLIEQANALDAELSQPAPQPTRQQIEQLAAQMVRAQGQPINDQTLAAALPEAAEKLREDLLVRWSQEKQQKLIQRQLLEARLRDNAARQNTNTNRFGVVGLAENTAPAAPRAPVAPAPSLEAAQRSFAARLTGAAPAAPAASLPSPASISVPSNPAPAPAPASSAPASLSYGPPNWVSSIGRSVGQLFNSNPEQVASVVEMWSAKYRNEPPEKLRARLALLPDPSAPEAVAIQQRLLEVDRGNDQRQTDAAARLSVPVSSATSTAPRTRTAGLQWWNPAPFVE